MRLDYESVRYDNDSYALHNYEVHKTSQVVAKYLVLYFANLESAVKARDIYQSLEYGDVYNTCVIEKL